MTKKTVQILFSGGLDSTYLVYKALKEGYLVKPIYIEIVNNHSKTKAEKKAISELMQLFKEDFPNTIDDVKFDVKFETSGCGLLAMVQAPIWITSSLFYNSEVDELWIGYVMNDDAISFLSDIQKVYYAFRPFTYDNKLPKLIFPLSKISKEQIFNDLLPKKYSKLTYSCEYPVFENEEYSECGSCIPCSRKVRTFGESSLKKIITKNSEISGKLQTIFTSVNIETSSESIDYEVEKSESYESES